MVKKASAKIILMKSLLSSSAMYSRLRPSEVTCLHMLKKCIKHKKWHEIEKCNKQYLCPKWNMHPCSATEGNCSLMALIFAISKSIVAVNGSNRGAFPFNTLQNL